MARIVTITNGSGSAELINDTYNVTSDITGYDNASITPSTLDVVENTNTYSFTVSATGTLTLHVTDTGVQGGTPIVGATFKRTDAEGTEYGNVITTNDQGDAVFNNVPFNDVGAPTIYFKQLSSDKDHEFSSAVQNTSLTTSTSTLQIQNPNGALRTITLTDQNYENLPVESGTITLTN